MKANLCFGLLLLNSFFVMNSYAQEATNHLNVAMGNNGVDVGLAHGEALTEGVDLTFGATVGMDSAKESNTSVQGAANVGVSLSLSDLFRINPLLTYKCEGVLGKPSQAVKDETNGCALKGGAKLLVGERDGFNLGLGYEKALGDLKQGENHMFYFMFQVPLSANDEERINNEKGDMDFNDSRKEISKSSGVSQA